MYKNKISIVIPCFNEEININEIHHQLIETNLLNNKDYEIIFVDNGSKDNTAHNLTKLLDKFFNVRIISISKNIGYGNGMKKGIEGATNDIICTAHADLQVSLIHLERFFDEEIIDKFDVKKAYKVKRINRSLIDIFFTKMMSIIVFIFKGHLINDINAQPKIFSKKLILNELSKSPNDFLFDLYLLHSLKLQNIKIIEYSFISYKRIHGEPKGGGSFIGKIKLSFKSLLYIIFK